MEIECFERRDLFTLRSNEARQDDLQQKGRDSEKDRGKENTRYLCLLDLAFEELMRHLSGSPKGADAAIGTEKAVHIVDHGWL